jgi:3-methyl-2-oxobutanoate hydroxymethyltransferase
MNVDFNPRFVRHYANLYEIIKNAVSNYAEDVINSKFPTDNESY